jgi:hypothetical protein
MSAPGPIPVNCARSWLTAGRFSAYADLLAAVCGIALLHEPLPHSP